MKATLMILAAIVLTAVAAEAQGDSSISSVQKALKDQGFYYGEVTGRKDADTTAAIRRYQIRNGLQITGELNAETQKSLGVKSTAPAPRATPRATAAPVVPSTPRPRQPTAPDASDLRDDSLLQEEEDEAPPVENERTLRPPIEPGYEQGPRAVVPDARGLFAETPYEMAPPEVQQQVIVGAQSLLARQGYYRSGIDGVYGPGMQFALRAYQSRYGLEPNGRLDLETLASLGLLRERRMFGNGGRRPRFLRRPALVAPNGEPVYIPR